jgi:hypothetical protein
MTNLPEDVLIKAWKPDRWRREAQRGHHE